MNPTRAAELLQLIKLSYLAGKQDDKYVIALTSFQLSDLERLLEEQVYA